MAGLMAKAAERGETTAIVLTAAAGGLAALIAALIAGGGAAAVLGGVVLGLVIGALAGVALSALPAAGTLTLAGRTPWSGASSEEVEAAGEEEPVEAPVPSPSPDVLLGSIGHRFRDLAERQLSALHEVEADVRTQSQLSLARRLAARTRRAANTLQVLADHPASHETTTTCSITDVLREALADVDEQDRVDYRSLQPASVDGEAVPDLIHLLAELIDNAVTASQAQGTPVTIIGRQSTDGYVLSVVDEGVGMEAHDRARANSRLLDAVSLDWQAEAAFGLSTAGRLAARHGIGVTLLEAPTDGITAKVRLPARLVGGRTARPDTRRDPTEPMDLARAIAGSSVGRAEQPAKTADTAKGVRGGRAEHPDESARPGDTERTAATQRPAATGGQAATGGPAATETPPAAIAEEPPIPDTASLATTPAAETDQPTEPRQPVGAGSVAAAPGTVDIGSAGAGATGLGRRPQRARPNPREVTAIRRDPAPVARKTAETGTSPGAGAGAGPLSAGGDEPRTGGSEGRGRSNGKR